MQPWKNKISIAVLALCLFFAQANASETNGLKNISVQSFAGVASFDKSLSFDSSPLLGIGAGYDLGEWFQLNLSFFWVPTRQDLRTASSKLTTNVQIFEYQFGVKIQNPRWNVAFLTPFLRVGLGGLLINPDKVVLDLGGGQMLELDPKTEHKALGRLGGGLQTKLSRHLDIHLSYAVSFYKSQRVLQDGLSTRSMVARNSALAVQLDVHF